MMTKLEMMISAMISIGLTVGAVLAADEITLTTRLQVNNDYYQMTRQVNASKIDQKGDSMSAGIQSIQTGAWEQILLASPDVSSNGYAFFRCTTTNTDRWIDVGSKIGANYNATMRFYAGDFAVLRLHPTNLLYATAGSSHTGVVSGVNLEFWNNED